MTHVPVCAPNGIGPAPNPCGPYRLDSILCSLAWSAILSGRSAGLGALGFHLAQAIFELRHHVAVDTRTGGVARTSNKIRTCQLKVCLTVELSQNYRVLTRKLHQQIKPSPRGLYMAAERRKLQVGTFVHLRDRHLAFSKLPGQMRLRHVFRPAQVFQIHVGSLKAGRFGSDARLPLGRHRHRFFLPGRSHHVFPSNCLR